MSEFRSGAVRSAQYVELFGFGVRESNTSARHMMEILALRSLEVIEVESRPPYRRRKES